MAHSPTAALALFGSAFLAGCSSAYFSTMERFGVHKRDILVDRVEDAREGQAAAQEQFRDTFEAFRALTGFAGGELEDLYDRLKRELALSERRADFVHERIERVEDVARALFEEWEEELDEMENPDLRRRSEDLLRGTRDRYRGMIGAMRRAESRMEPVLTAFRDHVLFLKHNLNARAVASLEAELEGVEADVEALIADLELSIAEADAFLERMAAEG